MITRYLTAAVLTAIAASASAHEGLHGPGAKFDANKDHHLSLEEYTAFLKSRNEDTTDVAAKFKALDTDASNLLSGAEFGRSLKKDPDTASNK